MISAENLSHKNEEIRLLHLTDIGYFPDSLQSSATMRYRYRNFPFGPDS